MNEARDFDETVDGPAAPPESLDAGRRTDFKSVLHAGLAAGFGKPADPHSTIDHDVAAGTDESQPAADQRVSEFPVVPGYDVQREIARGGMGCVLAARDLTLDRGVALKILLPRGKRRPFRA